MELIKNFVVTLVTTLIFITAIELIGPDNSMKKYLKFVLGLILIAVILNPIINFFSKGETVLTEVIGKYSKEVTKDINDKKKTEDNNKIREESFKNNFNRNCESLLNKEFNNFNFVSAVECKVDFTDVNFKIIKLRIGVQKKGIKKVEKVELGKEHKEEKSEDNTQKEIKRFLSKELDLEEDKIEVHYR
ncbi:MULTISPECIES: stage III sporulation protein AF [Clostridium]|uniref:Stage III sporulation protein AF n=1 Tax=Clostridium cibarium TaxID=2762247 RepID=A0ABR8PPC5_9CLOT|nr:MULTISPECIES: stage III sporulation protein AF [Clostridium]MBD7910017.1 stage III sporulation protein AF [Clostridium cibarium]